MQAESQHSGQLMARNLGYEFPQRTSPFGPIVMRQRYSDERLDCPQGEHSWHWHYEYPEVAAMDFVYRIPKA